MKEFYRLTKQEKEEMTDKIRQFLEKREEISFAYIFGSFLEPEHISFRDIDVAVFLSKPTIKKEEVFNYETKLSIELGRFIDFSFAKIDIKVLNFAPVSFQNNVFSRGNLLFAKDSNLLVSLIEKTSQEAVANYNFSMQSFKELISR